MPRRGADPRGQGARGCVGARGAEAGPRVGCPAPGEDPDPVLPSPPTPAPRGPCLHNRLWSAGIPRGPPGGHPAPAVSEPSSFRSLRTLLANVLLPARLLSCHPHPQPRLERTGPMFIADSRGHPPSRPQTKQMVSQPPSTSTGEERLKAGPHCCPVPGIPRRAGERVAGRARGPGPPPACARQLGSGPGARAGRARPRKPKKALSGRRQP